MRRLLAVLFALLLPSSAFAAGTIVYQGGTGSIQEQVNRSIANTAPSFSLTDTTGSAKSLTIAVDANLAQLRESAGAANSLFVLDLANNIVGIGTAPVAGVQATFGGDIVRLASNSSLQWGNSNSRIWSNNSTAEWYVNTIAVMKIDTTGYVGLGANFSAASLLDLRAGDLTQSGANGQKYVQGRKTELTTIAAAATSTTTITIPANAILKAVEMRVTVAPPGTATMVVTATTSGTVLQQGASMSTALNTTDVGTRAWGTNYTGVAAQTITITPNATPSDATGRVRFDIYYEEATAPTS